jgi:hypothetical protein
VKPDAVVKLRLVHANYWMHMKSQKGMLTQLVCKRGCFSLELMKRSNEFTKNHFIPKRIFQSLGCLRVHT